MKTDKSFKLRPDTKSRMAMISDDGERKFFKKAMIQSQVIFEANKKKKEKSRNEAKAD